MSWRLRDTETGLLVVDVQEKLVAAVKEPSDWLERLQILVQGVKMLGLPVIMTEQMPSKLGKTVASLGQAAGGGKAVSKTKFSAAECARELGRKKILVAGCEAHICIRQTVYELRRNELQPVVVADAIGSRRKEDREMALREMRHDGIVVTTVEAVLFEIMESCEHAKFREIQALVK